MKNQKQKDTYAMLKYTNAHLLGTFRNDLGQFMEFYEHPNYGEEAPIFVAFPNYDAAMNSQFFDLEDMTATYHSIGMFLDSKDEDMDYVPRFLDGEIKFKYEL